MALTQTEIAKVQGLIQRGHRAQALDFLVSKIAAYPQDVSLLSNIAKLSESLGKTDMAVSAYLRLYQAPGLKADTVFNIGFALKALGEYAGAIRAYETALTLDISAPEEVHLNIGVIHADFLFDTKKATAAFKEAARLNPRYLPAYINLGNIYEETADFDAAIRTYQDALTHIPDAYEALARLANAQTIESLEHPTLALIEAAVRSETASEFEKECLLFALGTALDGLGEYDRAFSAYRSANKAGSAYGIPYSRELTEAYFSAIKQIFPGNLSGTEHHPKTNDRAETTPQPIFICGMFRSGSTLAEQILGAHSAITPKGELDFFAREGERQLRSANLQNPQRRTNMVEAIRSRYEAHAAVHQISTPYFTDKRPDNLLHLGLIKLIYPNAKIIHTVRAPLDNYLSIYFTQMSDTQNYARDLKNIAHYGDQQTALMAHWTEQFSADIFQLSYDSLIESPKDTTRRLLKFLGLDWEESCLAFHKNTNRVKTASYKQVRRPLYRSSTGRWENYRSHLEGLDLD